MSLKLLGKLALPIRAVSEYPLALAVAVSDVPSRVAPNSALEGVCSCGGEHLASSEIKSCVNHSKYLSFFYTYIIPQFRENVNSQNAQSFCRKNCWNCAKCRKTGRHTRWRPARKKEKRPHFGSAPLTTGEPIRRDRNRGWDNSCKGYQRKAPPSPSPRS